MLIILQEQTSKVTEYNTGTEFGEFTPNDSVKERHPWRQQEFVQCAYSPPYLANVEDRTWYYIRSSGRPSDVARDQRQRYNYTV